MPFGPYADFAECVAANQDKENPEAYCSVLEEILKGGNKRKENSMATLNDEPMVHGDDDDDMSADFHAVIIMEETWTGDGRYFEQDSLGWRDLPLPLMALDKTTEAHLEARLVGNFTRIERVGRELHGWGVWVQSEDDEVLRLQGLVKRGELRGISADLDDVEMEIVMGDDEQPMMVFTRGRVMGATVVPFPALQEAFIESTAALTAALLQSEDITGRLVVQERNDEQESFTAGAFIEPPLTPPSEWFRDPEFTGPAPMRVTDEGRVFGHIATWDTCHVGFVDQCVKPPRSATNYAHFTTGEILCDDGSRIPVGQITMDTNHAPLRANGARAAAHYDDTGLAVADIAVGEDRFGIWMSGALRPGVDPLKVRGLMCSDVSGDWRRIGSALELVGLLAVNVPGFPKLREAEGLVASLVASLSPSEDPERLAKAADRIAKSIGRSKADRVAELAAKVRGNISGKS